MPQVAQSLSLVALAARIYLFWLRHKLLAFVGGKWQEAGEGREEIKRVTGGKEYRVKQSRTV